MSSRLMLAGSTLPPFRRRWIPRADLLTLLAGGLTKDAGNPVLAKGSSGQWDDYGLRELAPVVDEHGLVVYESDGIWAYYGGAPDGTGTTASIGLAKSTTNGVSWTRYGGNPLIVPSGSGWFQHYAFQPSVVKEVDGRRVMLAAGRDVSDVDAIGCFTSTDGLTWTDQGLSLALGDFLDGATAVVEMGVPSLRKLADGTWLCLLEARKSAVTNGWRIFGATATDPTGTWTPMNSGQPLLSPTGSTWEAVGVANPHVIETTPGDFMYIYNGIGTGANLQWRVGFAYGTNLASPTRYASNPVIAKGSGGAWDDQQTETSFLLKEPYSGHLRLYYQGFSAVDGSSQIGLATA